MATQTVQRLLKIEGLPEKYNDIIVCHNDPIPESKGHVVFFGGDVQDYKENMEAHRDNRFHSQWNLEDTAKLIQKQFPDNAVWVVKPAEMLLKTFSVFSNFVHFTENGCPEHSKDQGSWLHLEKLFKNAVKEASGKEDCVANNITLMGFSKGCVVLNQLLYDLPTAATEGEASGTDGTEVTGFVGSVVGMWWLDGGHAGGSNTWITNEGVLKSYYTLKIPTYVLVTPYQVSDSMRKWIGRENKKFVRLLQTNGVTVKSKTFFLDEERCLENHFKVLTVLENEK